MRESGELINEIQNQARAIINRGLNQNGNHVNEKMIRDLLFSELPPVIFKKTQRQPMVMPILLDIHKGVRKRQAKSKEKKG